MKNVIDYLGVFFRVIIVVLLFVMIQLAVAWGFIVAGIDAKIYHGLLSVITEVVTVIAFGLYDFVRSYKREKLMKFKAPGAFNSVAAVVIGFGLLGLVTIYMMLAGVLSNYFAPVADNLNEYADHIDRYSDVSTAVVPYWDSIIDFFAAFLLVPIAEEMVFRGALFGEFNCKFNGVVSAILSAVVFGLLHGVSVHIGYALFCGLILALIYFYSGSIWVSYIAHAVFNFFGNALFELLGSGVFGDLNAAINQANGHAAVIEIICIVPAAAAFILIYKRYKDSKGKVLPEPVAVEAEAGV